MTLKIGVVYDPPGTTRCSLDPVCPKRGFLIDAMRIACDSWNLNCSFAWFNSMEYGDAYKNGTGTGLIGAIQRGEFDASLPCLTPTFHRYKALAFSDLYDVTGTVLVTRAPRILAQSLDWSVFREFDWKLYMSLPVVLFLVAAWISVSLRILTSSSTNAGYTFFTVCARMVTKELGMVVNTGHYSLRLIVAIWLLALIVFGGAFSGVLYSIKVRTRYELPFTDFETFVGCLEKGQCRIVTNSLSRNSILRLMASESDFGERIRRSAKERPPLLIKNVDDLGPAMLEEKNQYLVSPASTEFLHALTQGNRNCSFYITPLRESKLRMFGVPKKSTNLEILNKMATTFRELGLHAAIMRNYGANNRLCDEPWGNRRSGRRGRRSLASGKAETIMSLAPGFVFYSLGQLIALAAFFAERMQCQRRLRNTASISSDRYIDRF